MVTIVAVALVVLWYLLRAVARLWPPAAEAVGLLRPGSQQQTITGQCLGIGIICRPTQLLQFMCGCGGCPRMLVGLGQATPPDFIAKP